MKISCKVAVISAVTLIMSCDRPEPTQAAPASIADQPTPVSVEPPKISQPEPPESPKPSGSTLVWLKAEIERQATLSDELWAYARQFDDFNHIGTLYNELNLPEHTCYVLGHLLRRGEEVTHLEVQYQTDLHDTSTAGTHAIRVDAHSMGNFTRVANVLLDTPPDERVLNWNLDCVGQLGISQDAFIATRGAHSFYAIKNEGKVLQILGNIEPGFAQKVVAALDANPQVTAVALGSGGGLVAEAIKTGMIIRDRKLTTTLWNNCYSACPLVFLGGIKREVWSPYPKLGLHQFYTMESGAASPDAPIYDVVRTYAQAMGADPNYVLLNIWMAGPSEMNFLDPESIDLCEKGITTWVQRRCSNP